MATLWIREFTNVGLLSDGTNVNTPVAHEPGADQTPVTFSTSVASEAFGEETLYVGFIADAAFHYAVGPDPEATTGNFRWPADTPHFVGVKPGDKIAVIAAA